MFSLSPKSIVSNSHKRHCAETEVPASSKRIKAQTQPESDPLPPPGINLLNKLTTVLSRYMIEWLDEKAALQLLAVGVQHRKNVMASYIARLKPPLRSQPGPVAILFPYKGYPSLQWTIVENSIRLKPGNGVDPARYTAELKSHRPVQSDSSLDGYQKPSGQRWKIRSICDSKTGTNGNCVAVIEPVGAGTIQLTSVSEMSGSALQLLHDPRLVKLLPHGLLSEQQLKTLTQTQFRSVLILYRALLARRISSDDALTLTSEQLDGLREAALLEDLASCRISLEQALTQMQQAPKPALPFDEQFALNVFDGAPEFQSRSSLSSSSFSFVSSRSSDSLTASQRLDSWSSLRTPGPAIPHLASPKSRAVNQMAPADIARLMSVWPVEEMRAALYGADGELDHEWTGAFQRVRKLVPSLKKIDIFGFNLPSSSSSSSSSSSDTPLSLTSSDRSFLCRSEAVRQKDLGSRAAGAACDDVALLLCRMPSVLVRAVIFANGKGGNADWVTRFGKIIHLMPQEKIIEFLDTRGKYEDATSELFNRFENGLAGEQVQAVATAFNQIFIDLAEHLDARNYLETAEMFLKNLLGFMVSSAWRCACPAIIDQCREIWSLVQSKCAMTGTPVDRYTGLARSALLDAPGWDGGFSLGIGPNDCNTMVAFANFVVAVGLEENELFLKVWTDKHFSSQADVVQYELNRGRNWCVKGFFFCHAMFSSFPESEYGSRARRNMGMGIKEWPLVLALADLICFQDSI